MFNKTLRAAIVMLLLIITFAMKVDRWLALAEPRTWTVDDDDPKADFYTIEEAINAAREGDSIFVYSGTYYEQLIIDKSVTLIGEERLTTIVDGDRIGTVINIVTSNVVISGFSIRNSNQSSGTSHAGIKISGRECQISDNYITQNRIGIFVFSQKGRIADNLVSNNGQGVVLYDSSEVIVEANNFSENTIGISMAFSSDNMIFENIVANSSTGGHGITLSSSSFNNTVEGNYLLGNFHGIWLSSSSNNRVYNNTIANNVLLGIELANSSTNTFSHNNIVNNPTAVQIDNMSICIWDDGYPAAGNYWHEFEKRYPDAEDAYKGPSQDEPGSDQIWDIPYIINVDNRDRYPCAKSFGDISSLISDEEELKANAGPDQIVEMGTSVYLDGSLSTGSIVSYEWDFGDGADSTGVTCSHVYSINGSFTVSLTVRDAAGNYDTDTLIVTVTRPPEFPLLWISPLAIMMGALVIVVVFWRYGFQKKKRRRRIIRQHAITTGSQRLETYNLVL